MRSYEMRSVIIMLFCVSTLAGPMVEVTDPRIPGKLVRSKCDKKTIFDFHGVLDCYKDTFNYKIEMYEDDLIFDDYLNCHKENSTKPHTYQIAGCDNVDAGGWFEIYMTITHDCTWDDSIKQFYVGNIEYKDPSDLPLEQRVFSTNLTLCISNMGNEVDRSNLYTPCASSDEYPTKK